MKDPVVMFNAKGLKIFMEFMLSARTTVESGVDSREVTEFLRTMGYEEEQPATSYSTRKQEEVKAVESILADAGRSMSVAEIAPILERDYGIVWASRGAWTSRLQTVMKHSGRIHKVDRGLYGLEASDELSI